MNSPPPAPLPKGGSIPNNSWGRNTVFDPYSTSFGPLVIASNPPSAIADCSNGLVLSDSLSIFATMMTANQVQVLSASIDSLNADTLGIPSEILKEHSTYRYLDVDEEELEILELYPNPNSDRLYVSCSDETIKEAAIIIHDVHGVLIFEGNIHFSRGLDLRNLSLNSGVYTVELRFELNYSLMSEYKKLVFLK